LIYFSLSFVFSYLNRWDLRDYGLYFFSGYLAWNFIANSCLMASDSIVSNPAYVNRIYAPKALLPLAVVTINLVDLAVGFVIVLILTVVAGKPFSPALMVIPVSAAITAAFVIGMSLICAVCNVVFRDFQHLLGAALFLGFFLSPILWMPDAMPESMQTYITLNPVVPFLELFRAPLWQGVLPQLNTIVVGIGLALASLVCGVALFSRFENRFYYYL
jgi:ABC-2 type transport system permease protein/lipopolysaccharide transport system permease protein